jgi:septal ring factor EnvC (AmiA/AmiB activator)
MSGTKTETAQTFSPQKGVSAVFQDTRIDAAHCLSGQDSGSEFSAKAELSIEEANEGDISESVENIAVSPVPATFKDDLESEQLKRQAGQLAGYLRSRQDELDHREAQLNAELAQLETELRKARLCICEREAELEQRRWEMDQREKEILERLDRLAAADASLTREVAANAEIVGRSAAIIEENKLLSRQISALEEKIRQCNAETDPADIGSPLMRQQKLEDENHCLSAAQTEIKRLREELTAERRRLHADIRQEHERLAARQRQAMAELDKKREILINRSQRFEQSRASLLRLREELQIVHRETLENRLVAEELWMQLSGAAPPAALTLSAARIRKRLAEQHRQAGDQLREYKNELETAQNRLTELYKKLAEKKIQFDDYLKTRQEDLERQASLLVAREQTISQQQTRFEELSQQWRLERMECEQEINRLRLQCAGQSAESADDCGSSQ